MKYAVVTGSTQGIGKAVAFRLLEEDYFVILNYAHNDLAAQECKCQLEKMGYGGISYYKKRTLQL